MPLRFLVIGYGRVGRAVALSLKSRGHVVDAVDVKELRDDVLDKIYVIDASRDPHAIAEIAKKYDCACGCLPGGLGYKLMKAFAERGGKLVDVSFTRENPLTLSSKAEESKALIIPDCGIAPGLSNMVIGFLARKLDIIEEAEIKVGGLPVNPKPPLYHSCSWSIEDLLEEYVRTARYIENHEVKELDPLSLRLTVKVCGFELEAFPSDGLRTMLRLRDRVKSLRELTLRWKGHLDAIKSLRDLGFLSENKVNLNGIDVPIRMLTAKVLEKVMPRNDDMLLMEITARGFKMDREVTCAWTICGQAPGGLSTMARVTGAVCSRIALMLSQGLIDGVGVIPPEDLRSLESIIKAVLNDLKELGLKVEVQGLYAMS